MARPTGILMCVAFVLGDASADLAMVHIPFNWGIGVAYKAAFGASSNVSYADAVAAIQQGWDKVNSLLQPGGEIWGPIHPDLVAMTEKGCQLHYMPQKYWPENLAKAYFGDKTVFGVLRDPYERVVYVFRGNPPKGQFHEPTCDLNRGVAALMKEAESNPFANNCQLLPQAEFFDMPFGITVPVDGRTFPLSLNKLFEEHGYNNMHIKTEDVLHVKGCSNVWAGDLSDENKRLIERVFARDFELLCRHFNYCSPGENTCPIYVPEACPEKEFTWDSSSKQFNQRARGADEL